MLNELDEWKQAASVEAGLRREFLARALKAEAEVERLRALIQDVEYECCEHCRPGVRHFLKEYRGSR